MSDSDLIDRYAAIDVVGIDEEIRCEMCRNPMHTDRGCDGGCTYDEKLYKRIMQILDERIKPLPSAQPEIIHCRDCRWRKDQSGSTEWLPCRVIVTPSDFYCGRAERRTDG